MRIVFLLDNAYGIGGTIRSTVNLSGALAERHEVEVVSLRRGRDEPALAFDPRVTLTPLMDLRRSASAYDGDDPRYHQHSERFTEGADHFERGISTRLGDLRLEALLRDLEADVVIGTRPKINDYLAAYGTGRYLRIGQEHLTHTMHSKHIRTHQDAAISHLDAFVTVSYADAADYRTALPGTPAQIVCIPNAVPPTDVEPSDGQAKLIVAAGRLIKVKRYDRLLRAFALVSEKHPDWTLRLYGRGKQHAALRATINELGLYDRAFLMGARSPIDPEWAKGAIAAVSSDGESFGMTLVEAMHCGVPVVSTDCRYGPGEIIANGKDGLLSPIGDTENFTDRAYADALLQLVEDPALRRRMSEAALRKAARYAPDRIAGEYERLFEKLLAERPAERPPAPVADAPLAPPGARARASQDTHAQGRSGAAPTARPGRTLRRLLAPVLRPVLRRVRGRHKEHAKGLPRPLARVRVDGDGSLVVRLRADRLPEGQAALLLRARRQDATAPVRMPLPPRGHARDGWTEVRLARAGQDLAEARWDVYVERASDGKRKRVQAGTVETARLLTLPAPLAPDGALAPWVPYATSDGYLAVRAWHRTGHAEVTSVALGRRGFTLRATLYGEAARALPEGPAGPSDGPVLLAVPRGRPEHVFEHRGRLTADSAADPGSGGAGSPLGTTPPGAAPPDVTLELPYELPSGLAEGASEAVWDLWLRPGKGLAPVRLARLLGDLADRKKTDVTPRARLGGSAWSARLYFSLNNNLALTLQPVPQEHGAAGRAGAGQGAREAPQKSRSSSPSASASA